MVITVTTDCGFVLRPAWAPRELAPVPINAVGISVVLAERFARIFFPNAINIAVPVLLCPGIHAAFKDGDAPSVDTDTGVGKTQATAAALHAEADPPNIQLYRLLKSGGLVEGTEEKWARQATVRPG